MDKLTAIKIKYQNGTYSDQIPISALAQNIEWDDQYGLMDVIGDVDVDADGSIQSQIDNIIAEKGAANGIAELDSTGKVPSSQLPSYVDDVLEYDSYNQFPATGETGKIYVDKTTNLTYRWSGSGYVEISPSLALGETSSTAYRGDRGKTAYDHATESNRLTTATASGFYKVASTSEGHIANLTTVQKSDITGLGVPESDTKNTAGSTDTSSKIFLIGATSQADNPQTYSHDTAYVGADGLLYSGGDQVLTQHQTIKQDGVSGATANRFGVCSTAADTAAKTVSITSGTFNLESGAQVSVKFNNINGADNPTLNVNNTGAKSIFVNSSQITTGSEKLLLKGTVSFVYDGTQWHLIGGGSDSPPVVELTQAQYDALSEEEKNMNVVYMITNGTTNTIVAEDIVYDNTGTILTSNTVQDAIDELARGAVKELTLAQYNALTPAEQNNGTIYYITDDVGGAYASEVMYDNTQSGLNADDVQDAIDEMATSTIKKSEHFGLINNIPRLDDANANDYTTTGVYYFGRNATNVASYSIVLVFFPASTVDIMQVAFNMVSYKVSQRRRDTTGVWGQWREHELVSQFKVKPQSNGLFGGLVQPGQMWLIFAQRVSVTASVGILVHNYNGTLYMKEIWKDSSIGIDTNNQGTVSIKHNGSNDNIYACAIRLY